MLAIVSLGDVADFHRGLPMAQGAQSRIQAFSRFPGPVPLPSSLRAVCATALPGADAPFQTLEAEQAARANGETAQWHRLYAELAGNPDASFDEPPMLVAEVPSLANGSDARPADHC